ncbi:hypothetical protein [Synechococcus sp. CC9311]|uniref:hypothetical protein n=1 Tax=Synechococcus sp. (strain CC9311) TaxID=64471 RepID=UPI00143A4764|nr:hypothetical protein [Synechococcus sp. CC9311]
MDGPFIGRRGEGQAEDLAAGCESLARLWSRGRNLVEEPAESWKKVGLCDMGTRITRTVTGVHPHKRVRADT